MTNKTKLCIRCKEIKPESEFYTRTNGYSHSLCKPCYSEYSQINYRKNRESNIKKMRVYRESARIEAINHYGGKCVCCGETKPEFLAIDHVNGDGNIHRKKINRMNLAVWLRINNYPDGFRVLCHNCNCAIGFYGYCPHGKL